jgi:hypothetical protein
MNLFEAIQQFRTLSPDPGFTEKSKRMILASPQKAESSVGMRGVWIFLHTIETGAALALAGFFVLLATGSFSGNSYLAPVQYSVIDPGGLHAEADAIDMQIQLADISYAEVSSTAAESTAVMAGAGGSALSLVSGSVTSKGTGRGNDATTTASGAASSTLSVDQALQQLSQ